MWFLDRPLLCFDWRRTNGYISRSPYACQRVPLVTRKRFGNPRAKAVAKLCENNKKTGPDEWEPV